MKCDDFRGISISSILSKIFEYCFLDRFHSYLATADNQFGLKKNIGCNHAIFSVRKLVERATKEGRVGQKSQNKVEHFIFIRYYRKHHVHMRSSCNMSTVVIQLS